MRPAYAVATMRPTCTLAVLFGIIVAATTLCNGASALCNGHGHGNKPRAQRGPRGFTGPCVNITTLPTGSRECANGGVRLSCPSNPSDSGVVCSGGGGGGGPLGIYSLSRFVDPINGSDAFPGNAITEPAKTLEHVLSLLTDASVDRIYTIFAFDGVYPQTTLTWPPFVNLFGLGQAGTSIVNSGFGLGIRFVPLPGDDGARAEFNNVDIHELTIDTTGSADAFVQVVNANVDRLVFSGWNDTGSGQLLVQSSTLTQTVIIESGEARFVSSLFDAGPVIFEQTDGLSTYVEINGGQMRGSAAGSVNVFLENGVNLLTRGVEWTARVLGTSTGRNAPSWQTDSSSFPFDSGFPDSTNPNVRIDGHVCVQQEDQKSSAILSDAQVTITLESVVYVKPQTTNMTVFLPPATCSETSTTSFFDREIIIKRLGGPTSFGGQRLTVNVTKSLDSPFDSIDDQSSYVLLKPYQFVRLITSSSTPNVWSIIGPTA